MDIAISKTINLAIADLYLRGKLVPAGDLVKLTVERDYDQPDACSVVLANGYSDVVTEDTLEVRARLEDEQGLDPKTVFFGKVVGVEPYYRPKEDGDRTKLLALDHLSGVRLSDIPSPVEIVVYLGIDKSEYIMRISRFIGSDGDSERLAQVLSVRNLRSVLNAIPGGHSANRDKFAAELKDLLPLDHEGKQRLLRQMHARELEGPFPAIGGFRFVYVYPAVSKGTTVVSLPHMVITVDR